MVEIKITESARVASFLVFLLAIVIGGVRMGNSFTNVESEWNYILQTAGSLEIANKTSDLERKHFYIQEAIGLYQEGPNLLALQMLSRQNSSVDIDYILPKVITDLKGERTTAINSIIHSPRALAVSLCIVVLAVITLLGTIAGGEYGYSKWTVETQHAYIAFIGASFVVLLVGSLP